MTNGQHILKDQARARARALLAQSQSFHAMDRSEQMELYKDVVDAEYNRLSQANGLAAGMAVSADDDINEARHLNRRIDTAGDTLGDAMRSVNFPQFVSGLLEAVFDANLNVTLKQMEAYTNLLKQATASISTFINAIDNTAAFGYLVEHQPDQFSLLLGRKADRRQRRQPGVATPASSSDKAEEATLLDKSTNRPADLTSNDIKAKIMDAKIKMAEEQRTLLRETILMGITRLVVERGTIKAGVNFKINASETIDRSDEAHASGYNATSVGWNYFIGPSFSHSQSRADISVATTDSTADSTLTADVTGSVEIVFKSDYFKLDNFAAMYGQLTAQGQQQNQPRNQLPSASPQPAPAPAQLPAEGGT